MAKDGQPLEDSQMYNGVSMSTLIGETIIEVKFNNPEMPKLNPYNGYTLITKSGREFVIWNSLGETNLSEITKG